MNYLSTTNIVNILAIIAIVFIYAAWIRYLLTIEEDDDY